jgi:hypothetical protein
VIGLEPASMRIGWREKEDDGCVLFDASHAAQYAALLRPTRATNYKGQTLPGHVRIEDGQVIGYIYNASTSSMDKWRGLPYQSSGYFIGAGLPRK